jgi:release factor glutamine methyltransferase
MAIPSARNRRILNMENILTRSWRRLFSFTAANVVKRYVQKERNYAYKGLKLKVYKDVFHPGFFRSTKIFAAWLASKPLTNINVLELGCGSGLLSLVAAKKGALVTATDINPKAVSNTKYNATINKLPVKVFYSDLFTALSGERFDMVLINPPYYPKTPQTDYEHAWFCGERFDYFEKLFPQIKARAQQENHYMILSDTCDIQSIRQIAEKNVVRLEEEHKEKIAGELLTIYSIKPG